MSPWKWWIAIAGTALVAGGVAWLSKLWVIVATDGRVVATGAAGAYYDLGLYLLMVGSTGVGLRLTIKLEPSMRVVLAVVSPFAFFFLFGIFLGIGYALVAIGRVYVGDALPSYLLEEGGIFLTAVTGLVAGIWQQPRVRAAPRVAARRSPDRGYGRRTPDLEAPYDNVRSRLIHRSAWKGRSQELAKKVPKIVHLEDTQPSLER